MLYSGAVFSSFLKRNFSVVVSKTNEYHRGRGEMKSKGNAILVEWPGYEAWIADFLFSWVYMEVLWCSIFRLVRLMVLEALSSKLRFRIICRMKSHPGPLVLPAHVCGVFVWWYSGKMCFMLTLTSLEHQFVCLVILYSISGFAWSLGPVWLDQWAQGRCWRIKSDAVIWKTSAVLHFSFIFVCWYALCIHDTSAWCGRLVLSTHVRPFSVIHNGLFVSLSREFIWSC